MMRVSRGRQVLLTVCLVAPAMLLGAPQDRPSISFYFRAIGPDGQPVADLKPADVTLKVDGTPRTIRALTLTEFAKGGDALRQGSGQAAPAAPVRSRRRNDQSTHGAAADATCSSSSMISPSRRAASERSKRR